MQRRTKLSGDALAVVSVAVLLFASSAACADRVLVEWKFDRAGDFQGWQIGGLIADGAVRDGAMRGRATGGDPITFSPMFDIPAAPNQCVEICMKGTAPAVAELYWTETLEGQYGGFSAEKVRSFHTEGDGQDHVYRIAPFWQAVGRIIRLRFDPPNAGEFGIKWIRIVERPVADETAKKSWNREEIIRTWSEWDDVEASKEAPILFSPFTVIKASDHSYVSVRLATSVAGNGRLFSVSKGAFGWEMVTFPLRADGKPHSYNIPTGGLGTWRDDIILLALQLPTKSDAKPRIELVEVADGPRGPAEFEIAYFGPMEGINRAGRTCEVVCTVRNLGGEVAQTVTASLDLPPSAKILDGADKSIERITLELPKSVRWKIQAEKPGRIPVSVKVAADSVETVSAKAELELTQAPNLPRSSYVPEPRPVRSKYEVGAFYFPGFPTAESWRPIRNYPNRKPILGWYDESNPECADWQIKWAVEHGISFFMVDWYWCQGSRQLEHWVQHAYGKARYRKYLKWAVMWANHNPPNTHSAEDWRKVTQYWIDHCFNMPEYYRIDNRPAVFIWAPQNVRSDLGGSAEAARLYAMSQEMARAAGYPGIYFAAMSSHDNPERAKELVSEGYEGATTYHGFQLAWQRAKSDRFPFADLLNTCPELWREAEKSAAGLTYFPIVDTGWDARPWHGEKTLVAYGRTPEVFGNLCRQAKEYADQTGRKIIALGPMNEWGEGSYIEPYAEYGFQDLDQVREVFCEPGDWPPNVIPSDVGLGPYDLPATAAKTSWEFNTDGAFEGWSSNGDVTDLSVKGGSLVGRSTGRDPVLQVPGLEVESDRLHRLSFRMRSDRNTNVQVFWATRMVPMNGEMSLGIDVVGDGKFHDYELDLATNPRWKGLVSILRLDPGNEPGTNFAIDSVRLH